MDLKNQTQKRIIKFRGKNLKGQWHYGLLCHDKTKDSDYEWFISNSAGKPYAFGAIPETIGQFTGLHDKNGKDIYDGDVVVRSGVDNCVIEWRADKCKYDFKYKVYLMSSQWMGGVDAYYAQQELEVIGNIHENPELLNP